jgi:hypothetical protein
MCIKYIQRQNLEDNSVYKYKLLVTSFETGFRSFATNQSHARVSRLVSDLLQLTNHMLEFQDWYPI